MQLPSPTELSDLIQQTDKSDLSSIKGTVTGILAIINDPNSNPNDLREIIMLDPPLSAKVLRVANSPYYAAPRTINDID